MAVAWKSLFTSGGKHTTEDCMAAKDDIAVSQGLPKPSLAVSKVSRENKIKKRRAKDEALAEKRRSNLRRVSFMHSIHLLLPHGV